jgi:hypothetical protein
MTKRNIANTLTTLLLALGFVALCSMTKAVSPPPDGGYPGGNTAEGQLALGSLDTSAGLYNTAVGIYSLLSMTDGDFCTGVGAGTLLTNIEDQNTAVGAGAMLSNTTGALNTATGAFALFSNTSGSNNTAIGGNALLTNTEGNWNSAYGWGALASNTSGNANTASGFEALRDNVTGIDNTAIGFSALLQNIASFNTGVGESALAGNATGSDNTAIGNAALLSNTTGSDNTSIGGSALAFNVSGNANVAIGAFAAGGVSTADNVICIGAAVSGNNISNTCFIGNIRGVATNNANAMPVLIDSAGQLGTASSSVRFKKDIKCMTSVSEAILALEPVTFHYKSDKADTQQFGLIAEEVAKVNPDLVVRDENGEIYTVRYDAVNAMLLNEFLKEHRRVEELKKNLESQLGEQQQQINALTSMLERVTAQLELSKSATAKVVATTP